MHIVRFPRCKYPWIEAILSTPGPEAGPSSSAIGTGRALACDQGGARRGKLTVMCGRFSLNAPRHQIAAQFHVDEVLADEEPPRFNIAPTQGVLAVATSRDGTSRRLGTFRWGFVPSWAEDPSVGSRMINARAETAWTKPAFRRAFATRRCLLPASGYYEWRSGSGRRKTPFYFHRRDGLLLAVGGLWEVWHGPGGEVLRSCTILTTEPNALAAAVHDRMPVLVPENAWDRWLAPEPLTDEERRAATAPAREDLLVADRVSPAVSNPANEGEELVRPVPDDEVT